MCIDETGGASVQAPAPTGKLGRPVRTGCYTRGQEVRLWQDDVALVW